MDIEGRNIIISNAPSLDGFDSTKMSNTLSQYYDKMVLIAPGNMELKIHFKDYRKEGSRQKHVVHASVHYPGNTVRDEDWEWDIHKAVHNVLKKLLHNLRRELGKD